VREEGGEKGKKGEGEGEGRKVVFHDPRTAFHRNISPPRSCCPRGREKKKGGEGGKGGEDQVYIAIARSFSISLPNLLSGERGREEKEGKKKEKGGGKGKKLS